jgi:hypothetical protein
VDKSLRVVAESGHNLRKVIVKLSPDIEVGNDLLVLQVSVFQILQRRFSFPCRRITLMRPRKCPVSFSDLVRKMILLSPLLCQNLTVRIIQLQLLLEQIFELACLDSLHGKFTL